MDWARLGADEAVSGARVEETAGLEMIGGETVWLEVWISEAGPDFFPLASTLELAQMKKSAIKPRINNFFDIATSDFFIPYIFLAAVCPCFDQYSDEKRLTFCFLFWIITRCSNVIGDPSSRAFHYK